MTIFHVLLILMGASVTVAVVFAALVIAVDALIYIARVAGGLVAAALSAAWRGLVGSYRDSRQPRAAGNATQHSPRMQGNRAMGRRSW